MQRTTLSLADVEQRARDCLLANGCNADNANALAATMTAAERDGCPSHGLFRLPGYTASLRSGKVDGKATPTVEDAAPGVVRVDGHGGYAPLALVKGRPLLVERARETGIAALALANVHHFAALWVETEAVVEQGLVALAFTSYMPSVAPAGASKPFFGTNPMAFGWPRPGQSPMVFDQASAAMARGEIMIAARDGHTVPEGGGLDSDGNPTTDPNAILNGGTQLPFGGYKGSSIAMMVELLASGLLGQPFSYEAAQEDNKDGGPPRGGELMIALDPARFGDAENWQAHCEAFFAELGGLEGTRLPGERRHRNRIENQNNGVSVPDSLLEKIAELTAG